MAQFKIGKKVQHPVFGVGTFKGMYKPYGRVGTIHLDKPFNGYGNRYSRSIVTVDMKPVIAFTKKIK